ncbi:unnamed protein product [Trichobilharzia regenti]|nr:unnamed protein product [Trichobilharzia regenti]
MSRQLANRSRQEASNAAYMEWLKANGNKKCLQYYSHGYSDGKLIGEWIFHLFLLLMRLFEKV